MLKLNKLQLACVILMAVLCAGHAGAFDTSKYASQSKLATGKWVKVMVPESGVYEITYDELRKMGFDNPSQVHVYGHGGNRISEVLNGKAVDDLKAVPILRVNDKICFYGNGPVAFTMSEYMSVPHYTRVFNPYSQEGCYFLTEESTPDVVPMRKAVPSVSSYVNTASSMSFYYHERDLMSAASSGKEMLGEDFARNQLLVDYYLPQLSDSTLVLQTALAANVLETSYANAVLHSGNGTDTTAYPEASSVLYMPLENVYYNVASPSAAIKLSHPQQRGQFEPILKNSSGTNSALLARLDYFILTYKHHNILVGMPDNQMLMGYAMTSGKERLMLPYATSSTVVWFINNTQSPMVVPTTAYNEGNTHGLSFFANPISYATYVAFDPAKTLKKISRYEPVANQNLHGMPEPDLLIIASTAFKEQADRLADMHRAIDGITVAVVTQDQVFNEFSSGTRDAMAYRLLCKMLYDRDNVKFKNLLLFGTGSFDNRELMGSHPNDLLTYQSDESNILEQSYTSDDFFGMLADNSGANLAADKLSIGVGRITCVDVDEARSDVDKIIDYYANPDYGVWRNNTIVSSDSPDGGMYMFQAQGYKDMIEGSLNTGMHVNTVHDSMYPRSPNEPTYAVERKTATEAKQRLSYLLKDGAYFATYVGHAGSVSLTKYNKMWTISDVANTSYPYYPIMSLACCDVAHFDNTTRGIAELMFHKRDGGAIALLTSARMVSAMPNNQLNRNFINALFSYDRTGVMPTVGEAYKEAKLSFVGADMNKLSFFLLGDPAMRVNYPTPRFNITSVNGTDVTDTLNAEVYPLCRFEIKAQVVDGQGNVDRSFNGDATATLYGHENLFTTLSNIMGTEEREIYMDRTKLAEISGRVENGLFTGSMIAPRVPYGRSSTVLTSMLRVYAHKDSSDCMVNGVTKQIIMLPYDESKVIEDNEAPVITAMYLNEESSFGEGAVVSPNTMLYINVTDNEGINVQANSPSSSMKLSLDDGKASFGDILCGANVANGNKSVSIAYPLTNLTDGLHTLTYTVYDMLGNNATRTISFLVGHASSVDIVADKSPAMINNPVNFDLQASGMLHPEVTLRVTDATGKLVWMTTTDTFPVSWDMKDMDGNKVPAGLYRYFGSYNDGVNYGGTPINKLIVLEPVKTARK